VVVSDRIFCEIRFTSSTGSDHGSTSPAAKLTRDGSRMASAIRKLIGCSRVRLALADQPGGTEPWAQSRGGSGG
jgi:hypothetical protein